MKEFIISILIYAIFLFGSVVFYRKVINATKRILYWAIPIYLIATYLYFELINYVHIFLREKGIYIDFGHANLLLICIMVLALLTAVGFVVTLLIKRRRQL